MNIKEISLSVISMPLKFPFSSHLQTVSEREAIIVEVSDRDGLKGYGEAVAFSSPWYTEETVKTCYHMLVDFLIPLLQKAKISHPEQVSHLFEPIRRNQMAKASLETAIWDLYAKQKGKSLTTILGGNRKEIPSGAVVGSQSIKEALLQMEKYVAEGYKRIKLKINPPNDYEFLSEIRRQFPDVPILADANSAYTLQDLDRLKALDDFQLLMIEQPLAHDDFLDHAKLQKEVKTPICLDESIYSYDDVKRAIEQESCQVINIKIGRVGGLKNAKDIYDLCLKNGIDIWVGGMLEFGVSRAHNIALASLPGFHIPGDISASSRYWEEDITYPEVIVEKGNIAVPIEPGIGFQINERRLNEVLIEKRKFQFN
ncbi:o-succinylbenzoate synthase [Bacillus sp. CGMCC 1.16607]|uniref:o-succinylbenzoate synthase n=1 Tax=Bacillus sp. CGMCC 1.16607 TaxID=3351842 RepID=UPI0036353555